MIGKPAILGGLPAFCEQVPIARPLLSKYSTADVMAQFIDILDSGQVTNGRCVRELEQSVVSYLQVNSAVGMASCTSGLILTMQLLGLSGKEVLMPTFTFAATAHAAYWNRSKIVFVDSDPETFDISLDDLERKITTNTAGIIAVHVFGNPCEADALEEIARDRGLKLLFDAAHGLGTSLKERKTGTFGDAEVFSCSPTKILTALEGGIVSTANPELANDLRVARNYGANPDYTCDLPGLSARMTEIGAVLAQRMLGDIERMVENRNRYARLYQSHLGQVPGIGFQKVTPGAIHGYKDFAIVIDPAKFGIDRDLLCTALEKEGIATKKYFSPLAHELKPYRDDCQGGLPNARLLSANILCLPMYSRMDEDLIETICVAINRVHEYAGEIRAMSSGDLVSVAHH